MRTIFLDGRDYASPAELHEALKTILNLPAYYGRNADALHDCLAERGESLRIFVFSPGEGETARALKACMAAVEDLGGEARLLQQADAP